jgi:hypothetical protein
LEITLQPWLDRAFRHSDFVGHVCTISGVSKNLLPDFRRRCHYSVWAWCPVEMTVTTFFLCSGLRAPVPEELLIQLRAVTGVRLSRVLPGIVQLESDGTLVALEAVLAETAWSSFRVSESRKYRLQ